MQTLNSTGERKAPTAAIVTIAVIVITVMVGRNMREAADARAARVRALVSEASELAQSGAVFRSRLGEVRSRKVRTFADYRQQCLDVEKLLDGLEPTLAKQASLRTRFAKEAKGEPMVQTALDLARKISALDAEVFQCLRRETSISGEIVQQPPFKQASYYKEHIPPIEAEIRKLAAEQGALLKDAKQKGVELPADIAAQR
jgi:hypothetical protein